MIPRQFWLTTAILFVVAMAMAGYLWQLRRRESQIPPEVNVPRHVAPPSAGPTEKVTLWIANDSSATLYAQSILIPVSEGRQQRAEELIRTLLELYTAKNSPHPLQAGSEIHAVYLVDPGLAVIDLNTACVDGQVSGVLAEELTITSLIQTLVTNVPGLTKVKILVEGKERDTLAGHADLSDVYDVGQVAELAKELSPQ